MVKESAQAQRLAAARSLGRDLVDYAASLSGPLSGAAAQHADDLADRLANCILPRLANPAAPVGVVFLGPSGVGKSVVFNSLAGQVLSPVGALRPTTRAPAWLTSLMPDEDIWPPDLAAAAGHHADAAPAGLVIIDTPDSHLARPRAARRIGHLVRLADVTVLVTSATRYGDAAVWQTIDALVERGLTWGLIVNRIPAKALDQIKNDIKVRLAAVNLAAIDVLYLKESASPVDQLPDIAEDALRDWLTRLVPASRRTVITMATVNQAERDLNPILADLTTELTTQADQIDQLRQASQAVWNQISRTISASAVNWGSNPRLDDSTVTAVTEAWTSGDYAVLPELVRQVMGGLLDQDYADARSRLDQAWQEVSQQAGVARLMPAKPDKAPTGEFLSNWLRDLGNAATGVSGAPSSLVEAVKAATLGVAAARPEITEMAGDQAEDVCDKASQAMVTARLAAARAAFDTVVAALDGVKAAAAAQVFNDHAAVFKARLEIKPEIEFPFQDQAQLTQTDAASPPIDPKENHDD